MNDTAAPFAAGNIIGDHERQEDEFAVLDLSHGGHERLLFVIADGMSGHIGAAKAARSAVEQFCEVARNCAGPLAHQLRPALDRANAAIAISAVRDATMAGAGCTLLAAAVEDGLLSWISVGDSSLLLFRNGRLRRLNDDHSMRPVLSKLVATGRVSVRTAAQDPRRNALRSALRGGEVPFIDSPPIPLVMVRGDGVILASDGLETLRSRAIAHILKGGNRSKPAAVVEALLKATRGVRKPHQDNTSVIFYRYGARGRNATNRGNDRPLKFWLVIALLLAILSMTILIYS